MERQANGHRSCTDLGSSVVELAIAPDQRHSAKFRTSLPYNTFSLRKARAWIWLNGSALFSSFGSFRSILKINVRFHIFQTCPVSALRYTNTGQTGTHRTARRDRPENQSRDQIVRLDSTILRV